MRQHHEHEQDPKRGRGDREEITRRELGGVVGEEGPPRLGRGRPRWRARYSRPSPVRGGGPASAVRRGRAVRPSAGWPRASAESVRARQQPGRVDRVVAATISSASSVRTRDDAIARRCRGRPTEGRFANSTTPRQEHPEPPIGVTQPRALRRLALPDGKLMPESESPAPARDATERQTGGRRATRRATRACSGGRYQSRPATTTTTTGTGFLVGTRFRSGFGSDPERVAAAQASCSVSREWLEALHQRFELAPANLAEFLQVIAVLVRGGLNFVWSEVRLEINLEDGRDYSFPALDHLGRGA